MTKNRTRIPKNGEIEGKKQDKNRTRMTKKQDNNFRNSHSFRAFFTTKPHKVIKIPAISRFFWARLTIMPTQPQTTASYSQNRFRISFVQSESIPNFQCSNLHTVRSIPNFQCTNLRTVRIDSEFQCSILRTVRIDSAGNSEISHRASYTRNRFWVYEGGL